MLIHNFPGIGGFQAPGAYPNLEITFCGLKKMVIDVAIFIVVLMLLVLLILLPSSGDSMFPSDDCLTIRPQSYLFTIPLRFWTTIAHHYRSSPANMSKSVAYLDVSLRCVDAVDTFGRLARPLVYWFASHCASSC